MSNFSKSCKQTSKKDWLKIKTPKPNSHKGQNGILLIVAGSKTYFGALYFSIKAAVRFCDLVYVYSPENKKYIRQLKLEPNIIMIDKKQLPKIIEKADAFLVGPGLEEKNKTKKITNLLLKTKKPIVLDALAIKLANKRFFGPNVVLTPHKKEFENCFMLKANLKNATKVAEKYNIVLILKGQQDIICSKDFCKINKTGNAGMTKGGTGDCLAGLCAALLTKNEPFLSASAAAFLNGYAADLLFKKYRFYYTAEELAKSLALAAAKIQKQKNK
ncbi:MAG: NAD(P)H-hydrate dehydratase [Candidatus Micrarchaeota archaeon]|nr:NAD(P)H-hydrate dehydratase [Candidatus Micrarchaeota archaeon]